MADTHIKIKPVTPRVQYTANGSTTVFPYSFAIFDETDMVVYVDDTIITTGYTVSGAGQTDGGEVTFDSAPEDGKKITLLRNVPIERMTDFQEGGTFRPKNINDEFDRQTAFMQQVQEKVDRTLILPPTTDIDPSQILGEVERIYSSIDNVDTVADDIANVNAVAGDLANVDAVASDLDNIDAVAADLATIDAVNANKTNINAVAGNATNINAVAGNQTNIDAVAGNATNINSVAGNSTNINAVAGNATNINAVAGNESDIDTVAGIASDVSTVAGNTTDISNVATNMSDVNDCATNMEAIQAAPSAASSAATSAEQAAISAAGTHLKLFHHDWFDYELNDMAWLRADTFSWQDGTVYSDAYSHLVADYNGGTSTSETIGSYTITYVVADDGHKITTDETTVANIYNESGVAWYYVLDTANTRFKLPRKRSTQVIENVVNSDGSRYKLYADGWVEQGAFVNSASGEVTVNFPITMKDTKYTIFKTPYTNSTGNVQWAYISFYDRTTSGAKTLTGGVGFSWEVKGISAINVDDLQGEEKYLYVYVGQFSQSATEQTAGLNAELFNGKADVDLNNLSASGIAKFTAKLDADKIQQVSTLPVSPVAGTLYLIPE